MADSGRLQHLERLLINRGLPPPSRPMPKLRPLVFNLSDFGAVGDGVTVNTKAFEREISEIRKRGGGQLNVEPGYWLTAPFNLTSHMTLFLAESAVIIGMGDESYWPLLPLCHHMDMEENALGRWAKS